MELICIMCPNGCHIDARQTGKGLVITGNKCPRGEKYAEDEMTDPRRVVTCVARTTDPNHPCVPVKTSTAVPKKLIPGLLSHIYATRVDLPVKRGEIMLKNINGTGTDIVFTRTAPHRAVENHR